MIAKPNPNGKLRRAADLLQAQLDGYRTRPRFENRRSRKVTPHKEIEVILMRQLADALVMPTFIVDVEGTLLFYNEPAEVLLGQRFEETGELIANQWATLFVPTDDQNRPLPPEKLPLVIALRERRPAHADFRIRGLDQMERHIQATAFPLIGRANRFLGAVAIFWEVA